MIPIFSFKIPFFLVCLLIPIFCFQIPFLFFIDTHVYLSKSSVLINCWKHYCVIHRAGVVKDDTKNDDGVLNLALASWNPK